jgi:hypothetical protein
MNLGYSLDPIFLFWYAKVVIFPTSKTNLGSPLSLPQKEHMVNICPGKLNVKDISPPDGRRWIGRISFEAPALAEHDLAGGTASGNAGLRNRLVGL